MEVHGIRSWFDAREGVVVVEDDVLNVVRDIKAISPRLQVFHNPQSDEFDIVESCLDGAQRLVFSVEKLDGRVLHRLRSADHWHGEDLPHHVLEDDEDFVARVDEHNAQREVARSAETAEAVADVGERLVWALDWAKDRPSVGGSVRVPKGVDDG